MVQFLDPEGDDVLVPPGTYSVKSGPVQLILDAQDGASMTIEPTEGTHSTDVPFPTVISTSGEKAGLANSHLLVVLYPDGNTLQAMGNYPNNQLAWYPRIKRGEFGIHRSDHRGL